MAAVQTGSSEAQLRVGSSRARLSSRDQAAAVIQLAPFLCLATMPMAIALVVAGLVAGVSWPSIMPAFLVAVVHAGLAAWVRHLRIDQDSSGEGALRHTVQVAAGVGILWGVAIFCSITAGDFAFSIAAIVVAAGMIAWASVGIGALPWAGPALLAPMVTATLMACIFYMPPELYPSAGIVLLMTIITPLVCIPPCLLVMTYLKDKVELREQRELINILLKEFGTRPGDWVWHVDKSGRLERVSDRFADAARQEPRLLLGQPLSDFVASLSPENEAVVAQVEAAMAARETIQEVIVKLDRPGEEHWWRVSGKALYDDHDGYAGYIGTASDITAQRMAERRITYLAHHDNLTGLLNRAKLTDHLKHAVARLERYGSSFAVLFLDLDQFKTTNDTFGHLIGDELLVGVGQRIRDSISDKDYAARLGGDEFAIIVNDECRDEQVAQLAARLIETLSEPYEVGGHTLNIGVSIGISLAPTNGTRPDQILSNADLALYRAKEEGRGRYRFFEDHMGSSIRERRKLEIEIREAILQGQFVLHYQPLVSTETHRPDAFEALVRWNHPTRGTIQPADFIPVAEQSGLIQQIGDWTVREACMAAARWPSHIGVAVNLSAKHFHVSDIVDVVTAALEKSGLAPGRLELEITESVLLTNSEDVIGKLQALKKLGVSIAMDDFGTGYSSLSYLLKFPFDKIKIDKSFVDASGDDLTARNILRTIIQLAKSLDIAITAEGVETQLQADLLRELDCNQLQGFYFAKALDEIDLAVYLMGTFTSNRRSEAVPKAPLLKTA